MSDELPVEVFEQWLKKHMCAGGEMSLNAEIDATILRLTKERDEARGMLEEWVAWGYEEWQGGEGVLDRPTNKLPWKVYKIKEKQVE